MLSSECCGNHATWEAMLTEGDQRRLLGYGQRPLVGGGGGHVHVVECTAVSCIQPTVLNSSILDGDKNNCNNRLVAARTTRQGGQIGETKTTRRGTEIKTGDYTCMHKEICRAVFMDVVHLLDTCHSSVHDAMICFAQLR